MKSGPLTKPPGSLCDNEQLLWMSLKILEQGEQRRFLLESNTEVQGKLGHHKAGSCFPHISSSVLWILVKLGTYGKLPSRGIQRHRLQKIWRRTRRGRWVLVWIRNIGAFLFGNLHSSRSPFDVGSPPSLLICFQRYWGWFWSRKPGLISGILRGRYFV